MDELLRAEDVFKSYSIGRHSVPVLRGASLSVRRGEAVAVVGVSGAGKSTLLNVLGGLDRPQGGAVFIDGQDVYGMSPGRRTRLRCEKIGFVFQTYHLLPEMDVLENVMLPAMAGSRLFPPYAAMRRDAMELLDAVGLADRAAHRPMELSGGEQQRAALARALINDPDLVLADEPTGNLDGGTGQHVLDRLLELARMRSHSLVLVTHNEQVARASDRVLRLSGGVLAGA
jgi:ABC-type lipoprotein export system ATPase subunit